MYTFDFQIFIWSCIAKKFKVDQWINTYDLYKCTRSRVSTLCKTDMNAPIRYITDDVWMSTIFPLLIPQDFMQLQCCCKQLAKLGNYNQLPVKRYWKLRCSTLCLDVDFEKKYDCCDINYDVSIHWIKLYKQLETLMANKGRHLRSEYNGKHMQIVVAGDCDQVFKLLLRNMIDENMDFDINAIDCNGLKKYDHYSPLFLAANVGISFKILKYMLTQHSLFVDKLNMRLFFNHAKENGPSMTEPFIRLCGMVYYDTKRDNQTFEILKLFLKHPLMTKEKINSLSSVTGETAFFTACSNDNYDIVQLLLNDERVDVNIVTTSTKHHPFCEAVREDCTNVVRLLLYTKKKRINWDYVLKWLDNPAYIKQDKQLIYLKGMIRARKKQSDCLSFWSSAVKNAVTPKVKYSSW